MNTRGLNSFEQKVIADLAELKTSMKDLVGNGQPGRITRIEGRLSKAILIGLVVAVLLLGERIIPWLLKAV